MRDPFHDLHHQEAGVTSHIRLISEGGDSHATTSEIVSIDSIQATHTCTTESRHGVYRSATGCSLASPENSICSLASQYALELDRESVPHVLRSRLARLGTVLDADARVTVKEPGKAWRISNAGRSFSVRRVAARLAVYDDLS